jgi:sec-independent protein translocase protein TatB
MPDIGFLELLLVGAIAFLMLGPERMPELFAQVGRVVRKGRGWIADVRRQFDEETAALKNPLHEVEDAVSGGIENYNATIMKELGETLDSSTSANSPSKPHTDKKQDD